MKKRKGIAIILLAALVMTGCGKAGDIRDLENSGDGSNTETVTDTTETPEAVDETGADETPAQDDTEGNEEESEEVAEAVDPEHPVPIQVNLVKHSKTYYAETDYQYRSVAECEAVSVVLADESAELYPELAIELEDKNEAEKQNVISACEEFVNSYYYESEDERQYYDENDITLSEVGSRVITRADSNILSMYDPWYSYYGGVHGMYGKFGNSYDTRTGEELKFSDVVVDPQAFFRFANERIQEQYGGNDYEQPADITEYLADFNDDTVLSWWVDYQGVTIYFGPYELGSYAMGAVETKIFFSEAPQLFNPLYTYVPDSYVIPMTEMTELLLDMDGDGVIEYISYEEVQDPESEYEFNCTDVYVNGDKLTVDGWHYLSDNYIAFLDGKYYFVTFRTAEGDWCYTSIANLTDMKSLDATVESNGFASYGYTSDYGDDGYCYYEYSTAQFTDPNLIRMNKNSDFLGTMSGNVDCHMDSNGNILANSDQCLFNAYYAMKAKKDIVCKQVDYSGNVVGETKIKAGSYYAVLRGDCKTYADLVEISENEIDTNDYYYPLLEEGRTLRESDVLYRLEGAYQEDSYYLLIGDEPVSDLFENIMYAG